MQFSEIIKKNKKLKRLAHWALIPPGQARPRLWVRVFLTRFVHQRGKGSVVRSNTRMDVFPFNKFSMGEHTVIESFCTINNGVGEVIIGSKTLVGIGNVLIGPIQVGNNVIFAQHIVASGLNHGYEDVNLPISLQQVNTKKISIEDDCWIGANTVITAGVTIGKHSVIGAGSVVTKDIPPFSVAVGNPAKVIKTYDSHKKEWLKV